VAEARWDIEYYETAAGRCPVAAYLDDLDARDAAAVTKAIDLLEEFGADPARAPAHA
jgi:hypothetical protein